jgi:hypothetical protein
MKYYGKAESVASRIVEHFRTGNLPQALAPIFIRRKDNIPCRAWSWANQLLVALAGYDDARSYLEWQKIGRQVRKGEHGFPILEPCKRKVRENDSETGESRERMVLYGFHVGIRFGCEQTDGEPLPDRDHAADRFLDALPFVNVATSWGVKVKSYNGDERDALGSYRRGQTIAIGVENLSTWAHELMHAADDRLGELKESGQHWRSEIVAELGGAVLLCCTGRNHDADLGGCWEYVQRYAKDSGRETVDVVMHVLNRTCKAVALILEAADELTAKGVAA